MASWFEWLTNPIGTETAKLLTEPSDEAKANFSTLLVRWANLELWGAMQGGLVAKIPSIRRQYETWIAFRDAWTAGRPDVTMLSAANADLYNAEHVAEGVGYQNPFGAAALTAPDIAKASAALRLSDQAGQVIQDAKAALPPLPKAVPWWAYAAGAGLALGAAIAAGIALRVTPQAALLRKVAGEDPRTRKGAP